MVVDPILASGMPFSSRICPNQGPKQRETPINESDTEAIPQVFPDSVVKFNHRRRLHLLNGKLDTLSDDKASSINSTL